MIRSEHHGDVVRFEMWTRRSRMAGLTVSAYLMRGVLVDCGFPGVGDEVGRLLDQGRLRGVIVTHLHEDHAGNIEQVARRGIPIAAHPDTLAYARAPERIAPYRRFTWGEATPLVSPVTALEVDDFQLIPTPGHSPEHQAVWDAETRTLFSADLFLGVKVRVAHDYERPRQMVASLRRVLALEPRRMLDAHRGLIPDPVGALRAKVTWIEEMIGAVMQRNREGMPLSRIAREVLGAKDLNDYVSSGEYSRLNLVRAVLDEEP